jgi:predicted nucleic acid-binding protein
VIVYAESSAVLAWLLGEPSQSVVLEQLRSAARVVSSSLTAVECARGLARARAAGRLSRTTELAALRLLDMAESSWDVHDLTERVTARARGTFPVEPVRTLDALHLATALVFHEALGSVVVLSFDERVRQNAQALGLPISPSP